jgi:hypothetical protein
MYQLQNVLQHTCVLPVATYLFLLLTKFCDLVTKCIARSSTHTKSVLMVTAFAMFLGILTGHLGSTSTARLYRCLRKDRRSSSNRSHVPTDWEMENLPIIEITAPVWNLADLHMSRPLSPLTNVVNCISTASRNIWLDLAAHLFAISPPLACPNVSLLYVEQILVHNAPTATLRAGSAGRGAHLRANGICL